MDSTQKCGYCFSKDHLIANCPIITCFICQEKGHHHTACKSGKPLLKCTKCNLYGHTIEKCPDDFKKCSACGRLGHSFNECFRVAKCGLCNMNNHTISECKYNLYCEKCMQYGHRTINCRPCRYCMQTGHSSKDCTTEGTIYCIRCKTMHGYRECKYKYRY